MVEAGGIEPPSEDIQTLVTTRLVHVLISPLSRPWTGCLETSQFEFRDAAQPANRSSLAH